MTGALRAFLAAALVAAATILAVPGVRAAEGDDLTALPMAKGLPVTVRTAMQFVEIEAFKPEAGTFDATIDLRLTWEDPRLRYPKSEGLHGYKEFVGDKAAAEIARIWTPSVRSLNRVGEAAFNSQRLRIFPEGRIEQMVRTTATYATAIDVSSFPFDRQSLAVKIALKDDTADAVDLDYRIDDVDFSHAARTIDIEGWELGLVKLDRSLIRGWDGARYAQVTAALEVRRVAAGTVATIFIPLFASLLIPFLATWMNRVEGGEFAVDAFELANVIIGGLFAVIALSFTISSSFPLLGEGDNTVTRLIGLNYVALSVGLLITVFLYRYNLPRRWFGAYVQEQLFLFLMWAFPFLFIVTGLAFVAAAAA
jgi:hypothetical protein